MKSAISVQQERKKQRGVVAFGCGRGCTHRERGGVLAFTLAWFSIMALFVFVIFSFFVYGIDLQEGRRQTQVVSLMVTRVLAEQGGRDCVQSCGNSLDASNAIYDCLAGTYAQLPKREDISAAAQAPVQFGKYDVMTGTFNASGNPVDAVFVETGVNIRGLPVKIRRQSIAYLGGNAVVLAPDPQSPLYSE